jgi:hypothetical protein
MQPVHGTEVSGMRKFAILTAIVSLAGAAGVAHAGWFSDELPPANSKSLSEIIKAVEDKGFTTIMEVDFDDGVWTIEAHQADGKEVRLKANPITGEIRQ